MSDEGIDPEETLAAPLPGVGGRSGGTRIAGRYELLSLMGRGGMGSVYRVRDLELDEIVALKVLHRDLLRDAGMQARFRQEVKLARRVTHKNVARTYDIGEHGGDRFLTMELVEGESLASRIEKSGCLPVAEALSIARSMCEGMAAAHDAGVIHRDLKPENVCIANDGRVVLMDFGIARMHLPGDPRKTSGQAIGTPAYMAPEQVQASDHIDARADVYALGAVLYEMLTGAPAWPGESPIAVAAARLFQPPPDPRALRPSISEPIATLVLRCMARDPSERVESAHALRAALEQLEAPDEAVSSRARVPSAPLDKDETAVAVLPFRNAGPPEDAHLAEGLTEDLVDTLAITRGLRVRARAAAADAPPDEIGRRLGVDVVIEGSVRRAGPMLRVSARLINVHDGFQIWSARFERPLEAALSLNDEVARAVARALSTEHHGPSRAPLGDPEALELYFRARRELSQLWMIAPAEHAPALARLREAVDRAADDPTIAAGYVALAARFALIGSIDAGDVEQRTRTLLERAPHLGEPWVALATLRFNVSDDVAGALRAVKRALLNAPSLADGYDLAGRILTEAGATEDAVAVLERALWLDPQLVAARVDLMRIVALDGRLSEMEALAAAGPESEPWQIQRAISTRRFLMWWRKPWDGEMTLPRTADPRMLSLEDLNVRLMAGEDLRAEDRAFLERLVASVPPGTRIRRLFAQVGAEANAFAGAHDEALRYVAQSVAEGLRDLPWIDHNPLLEPLRTGSKWSSLRAAVAARANDVLAAWRGPPSTVSEL